MFCFDETLSSDETNRNKTFDIHIFIFIAFVKNFIFIFVVILSFFPRRRRSVDSILYVSFFFSYFGFVFDVSSSSYFSSSLFHLTDYVYSLACEQTDKLNAAA